MNTERNKTASFASNWSAIGLLIGLSLALVVSQAQADDGVVAYAATTNQEVRQARVALDTAISGAARRANAALTADVRLELQDRVRSKLRLASTGTASRG